MFKQFLLGTLATATVAGGVALGGAAHAVTSPAPTSVTAVTHVINRPDNGHGTPAVWAYDSFDRTLTVTLDPAHSNGTTNAYTATITDKGGFSTVGGAGTPNQSIVPGAKIAHNGVKGSVNGTYALTVTAPVGDNLTGTVPATEDDNFTAPAAAHSTSNWPTLAFADPTRAVVNGGAYEWDYATACEKWTDSSVNNDGNATADGNITGKICERPAHPYVYNGRVVSVSYTGGVVGFNESEHGWPNSDSKCVEVWISGYGFGAWDPANPTDPGTSHIGFTCDHSGSNYNQGFLRGLAKGHTYALRIVPAVGSYGPGNNHPIPGAHVAYVDVFTPAA